MKKNMLKILKKEGGFTLIELILVITVLGILAITAVPAFIDVTAGAHAAARDGVIGAISGGVNVYRGDALINGTSPIVPATLDAVDASGGDVLCDSTNPCFGTVLDSGIQDGHWTKTAALVYDWRAATGDTPVEYTYDAGDGSFTCSANCP